MLCCREWKPQWSKESQQDIISPNIYRLICNVTCLHTLDITVANAAPVQGVLQPQEYFPSSHHSTVNRHCVLLRCNLSLSQSFQALWHILLYFPWQKHHFVFSIILLSSSGPHWLLFLLWICPISVYNWLIQWKVTLPRMWFLLFRKEAVSCWDFETLHVFYQPLS